MAPFNCKLRRRGAYFPAIAGNARRASRARDAAVCAHCKLAQAFQSGTVFFRDRVRISTSFVAAGGLALRLLDPQQTKIDQGPMDESGSRRSRVCIKRTAGQRLETPTPVDPLLQSPMPTAAGSWCSYRRWAARIRARCVRDAAGCTVIVQRPTHACARLAARNNRQAAHATWPRFSATCHSFFCDCAPTVAAVCTVASRRRMVRPTRRAA